MSTIFTGDFAKLTPCNDVARQLFSETLIYIEKLDTFHIQLVARAAGEHAEHSSDAVEDSTDYDTGSDNPRRGTSPRTIENPGHFVLSFNQDRQPQTPHLGWRVGKGTSKFGASRGVDFLLSKPGDKLSRSLASTHMLFRFNPRSGFLLLVAGSPKSPVKFRNGRVWESLAFQEQRLMHQPVTVLRAGSCDYELEYTVSQEHRDHFLRARDQFFQSSVDTSNLLESRLFRYLPGDSGVLRGRFLEFETQGSGTFGWVSQGVDTFNGDPVAIKELRITDSRVRATVMEEVDFGRQFSSNRGLISTLHASCEHGQQDACCNMERFYIFMPQALSIFSANFWSRPEIPYLIKLQWLREVLEGIAWLHDLGIMHRDIRPQNMLIMSIDPGRACLCDYGKAIKAETCSVTTIGPIHTLAPEVWSVRVDGPYNNKIDVWAYGYAVAEILGYSFKRHTGRASGSSSIHSNQPITRQRHAVMMNMLRSHSRKHPENEALVGLLEHLLTWSPEDRWSATEALEHECWNPILPSQRAPGHGKRDTAASEQQHDEEELQWDRETPLTPRKDRQEEEGEKAAVDEIPTQEFSQRTKEYIRRRYSWGRVD